MIARTGKAPRGTIVTRREIESRVREGASINAVADQLSTGYGIVTEIYRGEYSPEQDLYCDAGVYVVGDNKEIALAFAELCDKADSNEGAVTYHMLDDAAEKLGAECEDLIALWDGPWGKIYDAIKAREQTAVRSVQPEILHRARMAPKLSHVQLCRFEINDEDQALTKFLHEEIAHHYQELSVYRARPYVPGLREFGNYSAGIEINENGWPYEGKNKHREEMITVMPDAGGMDFE